MTIELLPSGTTVVIPVITGPKHSSLKIEEKIFYFTETEVEEDEKQGKNFASYVYSNVRYGFWNGLIQVLSGKQPVPASLYKSVCSICGKHFENEAIFKEHVLLCGKIYKMEEKVRSLVSRLEKKIIDHERAASECEHNDEIEANKIAANLTRKFRDSLKEVAI